MKIFHLAVVCSLIFAVSAEAGEGLISVHYPPKEGTIMEYGILGISLGVPDGSAGEVRITAGKGGTRSIAVRGEFICFTVPLEPGLNNIEIAALKEKTVVDRVVLSVFRRSDLISKYRVPPQGFKKTYFHAADRAACTKCHALEPGLFDRKPVSPATFPADAFDSVTVIAATSTCYSCHKALTAYPYVHGPASVWSCLSCHDPESAPPYSVKKPDSVVCYGCHVEQENRWVSMKYHHGPVTTGKCTICHSPHASENPFNLFKPTWQLCVNCHPEKGTGKHVIAESSSAEGHPTRNRKDPVRTGRDLTCASCHDPHASDSPHLWAFKAEGAPELCRKCHYDK